MKRLFWVAPFVLFAVVFFRPAPALAGLHICNKTDKKVFVAVASLSCDDVIEMCDTSVQGWFNIQAGDCATAIGSNLSTDYDYYYYADDGAGGLWEGSSAFCVDPQNAFHYGDEENSACAGGVHRNFRKIETGSYSDYTLSLTSS